MQDRDQQPIAQADAEGTREGVPAAPQPRNEYIQNPPPPEAPQPPQDRPGNEPFRIDWSAPWVGGAILILIGAIFLLRNITGGLFFENWWALFILIPALVMGASAYRMYEQKGQRIDRDVIATGTAALFPLLVAVIFLLDLDWGAVWPLFLILAGLAAWGAQYGRSR